MSFGLSLILFMIFLIWALYYDHNMVKITTLEGPTPIHQTNKNSEIAIQWSLLKYNLALTSHPSVKSQLD